MRARQWFDLLDKKEWGEGPWQREPDKAQWTDSATGFPCLLVRNWSGALCGYVGVDKYHACYGIDYNDVDAEVHGGLTFAGFYKDKIYHEVEEGEDAKVWWLGFDCAHWMDFMPALRAKERKMWPGTLFPENSTYKDLQYVIMETTNLAKQLAGKEGKDGKHQVDRGVKDAED